MSAFNHATFEVDSSGTDSVASSPRYSIHAHEQRIRLMYSFGGKIVPRPHDNQLRYVGGETRIVAVNRSTSFAAFLAKLSKLSGIPNVSVKYQLPNEDLDSLISVTTDEDMENMMEEFDRVAHSQQHNRSVRFRLFLFLKGDDPTRANTITSLLDGSTTRENWFFDALNSGNQMDGSRSEVSSVISEIPDYLFGLDNSEETTTPQSKDAKKTTPQFQDSFSSSEPASPSPAVIPSLYFSAPCGATSVSEHTIPSHKRAKTKNPTNYRRLGLSLKPYGNRVSILKRHGLSPVMVRLNLHPK